MPSLNEPKQRGKMWWRSLDEVVDSQQFQQQVQDEFQEGSSDLLASGSDRRHFLKIMGASMALAGLGVGGCRRWPKEHIVPYAHRPEGTMPGVPEYYASCFDFGGIAQGVLVTSNDGRPTKIEGNPEHPDSRGASDAFTQATVLDSGHVDLVCGDTQDTIPWLIVHVEKRFPSYQCDHDIPHNSHHE